MRSFTVHLSLKRETQKLSGRVPGTARTKSEIALGWSSGWKPGIRQDQNVERRLITSCHLVRLVNHSFVVYSSFRVLSTCLVSNCRTASKFRNVLIVWKTLCVLVIRLRSYVRNKIADALHGCERQTSMARANGLLSHLRLGDNSS